MKPCFCLMVFFPEIDGKNKCENEHDDDSRYAELFREEEQGKSRECNEKDNRVQLHGKPVKFPSELVFGFRIHYPISQPRNKST